MQQSYLHYCWVPGSGQGFPVYKSCCGTCTGAMRVGFVSFLYFVIIPAHIIIGIVVGYVGGSTLSLYSSIMSTLGYLGPGFTKLYPTVSGSYCGSCSLLCNSYICGSWSIFGMIDMNIPTNFWSDDVCIAPTTANGSSGNGTNRVWVSLFSACISSSPEENLGIKIWEGNEYVVSYTMLVFFVM